jgi:hypothetical protein
MSMVHGIDAEELHRVHLARNDTRQKIELKVRSSVRSLIGSINEIYRTPTPALTRALRDLRFYADEHQGDDFETIDVNLSGLDNDNLSYPISAVHSFQALFVQPDEFSHSLAHLQWDRLTGAKAEPNASETFRRAVALVRERDYSGALAVLAEETEDFGALCLRGVLQLGIAGDSTSASVIDLAAAEQTFAAAALRASNGANAAQALIAACIAALREGRFDDAERHIRAALVAHPRCGEAGYQRARLRKRAGDLSTAEALLMDTFDVHWSFALRAAADPLLFTHKTFLSRAVARATRRVNDEMQATLQDLRGKVQTLKRVAKGRVRADSLSALPELRTEVAAELAVRMPQTLKRSYERRRRLPPLVTRAEDLARDQSRALRAALNELHWPEHPPSRPKPDVARAVRWVSTTSLQGLPFLTMIAVAIAAFTDPAAAQDAVATMLIIAPFMMAAAFLAQGAIAVVDRWWSWAPLTELVHAARNALALYRERRQIARRRAELIDNLGDIEVHFGLTGIEDARAAQPAAPVVAAAVPAKAAPPAPPSPPSPPAKRLPKVKLVPPVERPAGPVARSA